MPRISKSDVNRVLDNVGKKLVDAGGADKRISRADVKKALGGLDGSEKKLVDVFFRFADHRDFKPGAQLTPKDVQRAVAYAKEHIVANYDLNANGLSKSEIAKMSLTGKLAVDVAKALKAAVVTPAPTGRDGLIPSDTTWGDLQDRVTITSSETFHTADISKIDATLSAQIIAAAHESTHTDVKTLKEAFEAFDQEEVIVTNFTDPSTGKKYTACEYGAGDNSYGGIFEAGKTTVAHGIHDGDIYAQ